MLLFHGGLVPKDHAFLPFTHFGSKQAALDRIKVNFEPSLPSREANSILYECDVDLGSKMIDLPDWHAAQPSGIILSLFKAGLLSISQKEFYRLITPINDVQRYDRVNALQMVLTEINHLHIDAIRYLIRTSFSEVFSLQIRQISSPSKLWRSQTMLNGDGVLMQIARAKSINEVWALHTHAMAEFGFNRLMYGFTRLATENQLGPFDEALMLTNHSAKYVEYFVGQRMYYNGPMTKWARKNEGSCSWSIIKEMVNRGQLSHEELAVVDVNAQFGITAGYTISFQTEDEPVKAAIGLAAEPGLSQDDVDTIWLANQHSIELACSLMHLQVSRLPQKNGLIKRLTRRQQEVLQWASKGKSVQDIAILMSVKQSTVEKHLRMARDALGSDTTAQAVMKASSANLFFSLKP